MVTIGPNSLLTCPLDESHRILRGRMQFHLVRCLKNHTLRTQLKCPWNPLHIIDKLAYEDHYKRQCEDMPGAETLLFSTDNEADADVGSVPVGLTNPLIPQLEEDWDAGPRHVGTYDPSKTIVDKMVLRPPPIALSKAKKKAWRQAERQRFQKLEEEGPMQIHSRPAEKPGKTKPPHEPRKIGVAPSRSNLSDKDSEDERKTRESHKENIFNTANGALPRKTTRNLRDIESHVLDEVPKLLNIPTTNTHDQSSAKSNTGSSRSNIEELRQTFENTIKISNTNRSATRGWNADNFALLDEAACPPNLVSSMANPNGDPDVLALSQKLAGLTTDPKKIDDLKALLMRQISQYDQVPNLISSGASSGGMSIHDRQLDDMRSNVAISNEEIYPAHQQKKTSFQIGIPKCAANFPNIPRNADSMNFEMGSGMPFGLDTYKTCQPSPKPE